MCVKKATGSICVISYMRVCIECILCVCVCVRPDRTPLHCAASCNDKALCEYLVRSGAAVMAVTESDEATAAQKCDPYAHGYDECENFLRGEGLHTHHLHVLNMLDSMI